jgi:molybdopterin molybdotransferase
MPDALLPFEAARHLVEEHASHLHPSGKELISLPGTLGRILAEPILADRDFPPFPRAARDGYALQAADLANLPALLDVIAEIKAGDNPEGIRIASGQAASIMTGAPAPGGADAVVMVEYTAARGSQVEIKQRVAAGDNIVVRASEAKKGSQLLAPGLRMDPATIAVAASTGRSRLLVFAKPKVAILATGNELTDIDVPPGPAQIRNSNSFSLAAQNQLAGAEPVILPIAPDEPARLRELIAEGLEADVLLLSGGVSAGKYDLVEQVLAEFQAEFFFTGVKIQPGKPAVFGRAKQKYFFGLPGNPVSIMVTFELFARPLLEALCGLSPRKLVFLQSRLKSDVRTKLGLTRFLPARLSGEFDRAEVELIPWGGSGDIAATALANCYLVIPPDRDHIPAGEFAPVLLR